MVTSVSISRRHPLTRMASTSLFFSRWFCTSYIPTHNITYTCTPVYKMNWQKTIFSLWKQLTSFIFKRSSLPYIHQSNCYMYQTLSERTVVGRWLPTRRYLDLLSFSSVNFFLCDSTSSCLFFSASSARSFLLRNTGYMYIEKQHICNYFVLFLWGNNYNTWLWTTLSLGCLLHLLAWSFTRFIIML